MKYRLERFIDNEWCLYGVYDASDEHEITAMIEVARNFGRLDLNVRVIKVNE